MRVNPNIIYQQLYSFLLLISFRDNCKEKANTTPNPMNIWLKEPNVPESSVGESYFMSNGAIAL